MTCAATHAILRTLPAHALGPATNRRGVVTLCQPLVGKTPRDDCPDLGSQISPDEAK
jgi:hypothetical protein